jgi:galactosylceramidase
VQRSQILDYLFKPSFGASLQMLKVEVGGDLLTTDGSESSHMHNNHTVDMEAGYEWWLMKQAKVRNPSIQLYGLPWAFPAWVGANPVTGEFNDSATPFTHPEQTCRYMLEWVKGAKSAHGLDIDYLGIWNEAPSDPTYVKMLRKTLDDAGFEGTRIVAADRGSDICDHLAADADYAKAVDVIGLHYPSDFYPYDNCHALNKPVWASEESSSYDDLNGAACWARVINSHYALSGITSSIMWNILGSYYPGTSWYASSMLTANQPWSGWYGVRGPAATPTTNDMPVVWATAHVTQFAKVGWKYLKPNAGSGQLPKGGFFTTLVDSDSNDFALHVVKNSYDHAACTRPHLPSSQDHVEAENVTFILDHSMGGATKLVCFHSNFERETPVLFQQLPDVEVGADGSFTLIMVPGDFYTISTVRTARHGTFETPVPPPQPRAPLPIVNDFDSTAISQQPYLWSQMLGAFEVHTDSANASNRVLRQMGEGIPLDQWSGKDACMPGTLVGMREWQDVSIAVEFRLPPPAPHTSTELGGAKAAACVGTRLDWTFDLGVAICVSVSGVWNLTYGGSQPKNPPVEIVSGVLPGPPIKPGTWHSLNLTTLGGTASAIYDGTALVNAHPIRNIDTGFAAMLTNGYFQVEFDNVRVEAVGPDWVPHPSPPTGCPLPPYNAPKMVGTQLYTRHCQSNGITASDQNWFLLPDFRLQHADSMLCAEAEAAAAGSMVTLQPCNASNPLQLWKNDYSNIHHGQVPLQLEKANVTLIGGSYSGDVRTRPNSWKAAGDFSEWTFMDSTGQLRSTKVPRDPKTPAVCLSLCKAPTSILA